jgi:hypothetical protein
VEAAVGSEAVVIETTPVLTATLPLTTMPLLTTTAPVTTTPVITTTAPVTPTAAEYQEARRSLVYLPVVTR